MLECFVITLLCITFSKKNQNKSAWYLLKEIMRFYFGIRQISKQDKKINPNLATPTRQIRIYLFWWTLTESNRWPFARQANALPAELNVLIKYCWIIISYSSKKSKSFLKKYFFFLLFCFYLFLSCSQNHFSIILVSINENDANLLLPIQILWYNKMT